MIKLGDEPRETIRTREHCTGRQVGVGLHGGAGDVPCLSGAKISVWWQVRTRGRNGAVGRDQPVAAVQLKWDGRAQDSRRGLNM